MSFSDDSVDVHDLEYDALWALEAKNERDKASGNFVSIFTHSDEIVLAHFRKYHANGWLSEIAAAAPRMAGPGLYYLDNTENGITGILRDASDHLEKKGELSKVRFLWRELVNEEWERYWSSLAHKRRGDRNLFGPANAFENIKGFALQVFEIYASVLRRIGPESELEGILSKLEQIEREEKVIIKPSRPDKRKLDEKIFWELIEQAFSSADADPIDLLTARLEAFSVSSIASFERLLRKKLDALYNHELWAVAYIVKRGCSDDSFTYFRAWIISQGETFYHAVIEDAVSVFAELEPGGSFDCEALLYVANNAHERRSGETLWGKVSQKEPKLKGKSWEEDQLPLLYPALCRRFGMTGT